MRPTRLIMSIGLALAAAGYGMTSSERDASLTVIHPGGDPSRGAVSIPAEHMPPAGKCRLWYPDRTPDDQPPVRSCRELQEERAVGAVLVRG